MRGVLNAHENAPGVGGTAGVRSNEKLLLMIPAEKHAGIIRAALRQAKTLSAGSCWRRKKWKSRTGMNSQESSLRHNETLHQVSGLVLSATPDERPAVYVSVNPPCVGMSVSQMLSAGRI